MNANESTIRRFYDAFSKGDAEGMAACYHPDALFSDPAFGRLDAASVKDMWTMLIQNSKGQLDIRYSNVKADDHSGAADWVASYTFSKTGRKVVNRIHAEFGFKDGLILRHDDRFDFWKWSRQAFGPIGFLLGWTGYFQRKVNSQALAALHRFQHAKHN